MGKNTSPMSKKHRELLATLRLCRGAEHAMADRQAVTKAVNPHAHNAFLFFQAALDEAAIVTAERIKHSVPPDNVVRFLSAQIEELIPPTFSSAYFLNNLVVVLEGRLAEIPINSPYREEWNRLLDAVLDLLSALDPDLSTDVEEGVKLGEIVGQIIQDHQV